MIKHMPYTVKAINKVNTYLEKEMATHSSIPTCRIHGQRKLACYSLWGCKELDTTEWLSLTLICSIVIILSPYQNEYRLLWQCFSSLTVFFLRPVLSVQFSHSIVLDPLRSHGLWHTRLPCPSPTPRAYSNSYPSSQWCHLTISSSVVPFSSRLQSFPASASFPMCWFFPSGGQSTGASASTSVLPMNTQDLSPSGWTSWIFLQSKGLSRVFSNTTVQKHQLFDAHISSKSSFHIHTSLLEKP